MIYAVGTAVMIVNCRESVGVWGEGGGRGGSMGFGLWVFGVALAVKGVEKDPEGEHGEKHERPRVVVARARLTGREEVRVDACPGKEDGDVDKELDHLSDGEVAFPLVLVSERGEGVVSIHERVDKGVCGDSTPLVGGVCIHPLAGDVEREDVVKDMEENDGPFLERQDDRVEQLVVLGQVEDVHQPVDRAREVPPVLVTEHRQEPIRIRLLPPNAQDMMTSTKVSVGLRKGKGG